MPSFLDFMERATTGPILSEGDFNLKILIPNVSKAVREFDIRHDPEEPVPADDAFADRLFEAAIEFLIQTGVYCDATNRVIQLDRAEILEAVENLPEGGVFGEDRDRRLFRPRRPEASDAGRTLAASSSLPRV